MNKRPDYDREFEAFLERDTPLQQRWREASLGEPAAQTDAAVRAAARRAVGARQGGARAARFSAWRVPLAVAATLVLGTTISVMVARQDAHLPTAQTAPGAPQSTGTSASAGNAASTRAAVPETSGTAAPRVVEKLPSAPAPVAAPPARREDPATPAATAPSDEAIGMPSAAPESESPSPRPQVAPTVPAPATADATREDARQAEALPGRIQPLSSKKSAADAAADPDAEIDAWLERIRALRRTGRMNEAEQSLLEFRLRHPEVALPEDLRGDR